jgi:hypothetical protein
MSKKIENHQQIKRQLSFFLTEEEEYDIKVFTKKNPWYTEEWFEKNKPKLDNYFDIQVTFEMARMGIIGEPDIESFLKCLEECF